MRQGDNRVPAPRPLPDQARPGRRQRQALVEVVYADLHRTRPDRVSYATCRLSDQVTFVRVVQVRQEPSPLLAVKAFGEFAAGIADGVDQPPVTE